MPSMPSKKPFFLSALGLGATAAALIIWELAARRMGSSILLPGPALVLKEFLKLFSSPRFFSSLGATAARSMTALGLSLLIGILVGLPAALFPAFKAIIAPFLAFIRSTPVLALIILLLIWFPQDSVPIIAGLLMAVPVVMAAVKEGVASQDGQILEMTGLFRLPPLYRLFLVQLPAIGPFLLSGTSAALSLIWKVVVAGEVLSQPRFAIGTGLQNAKAQLETAQALAWTLAIVALCAASDIILGLFSRWVRRGRS